VAKCCVFNENFVCCWTTGVLTVEAVCEAPIVFVAKSPCKVER
jgi:hypothetical protein